MIKTIKNWVYAINLHFSFLFFSMFSILGIQYEGSENGRIYIYATAIFSLLSLAFGLRSLISSRFINKTRLFFLILPLIITVIYIVLLFNYYRSFLNLNLNLLFQSFLNIDLSFQLLQDYFYSNLLKLAGYFQITLFSSSKKYSK